MEKDATSPVSSLDESQKETFDQLKETVFSDFSDAEKDWCTDGTLCRFLRARSWDLDASFDQLKLALTWRFEYKPHLISAEDIKTEMDNKGKMYRSGFDKLGHPILYMKPGNDNTSGSEKKDIKVKFLVYMMEKCARASNKNNLEKLMLVIDFKDHSQLKDMANTSTNLEVLHVLQNYYPESLHKAIIYNAPWSLSIFWNIISPFMEEITKQKINFVKSKKEFLEFIDEDQLESTYVEKLSSVVIRVSYGGSFEFKYSFEDHWQKEDLEFPIK